MGKGLSRDSKAQKLAFEHWIEAVIFSPLSFRFLLPCFPLLFYFIYSGVVRTLIVFFYACPVISFFSQNCLKTACRLIQGIDMGIACISIMKNGVKQVLVNHFSTGKHLDQGFCISMSRKCWEDCILL